MWVANIDVATSDNMVSVVQNEIVGKDFFWEGGLKLMFSINSFSGSWELGTEHSGLSMHHVEVTMSCTRNKYGCALNYLVLSVDRSQFAAY
jgi:hypothetical protein